LSPAVFANLRVGQAYLIVFALFAAAAVLLLRRRDRLAGVCLGLLLALKTSGVALVLVLIAQRRWVAFAWAGGVAAALAIAITPFIDASMWWVYPAQVQSYVARPASSVTAYQTTLGLVRHLCVADPRWNPSPAADCAPIAFILPTLVIGAATVVTLVLARRTTRTEAWIAAGTTLSVLSLPAVEEPHYVLMAIPLALVRLGLAELTVIAALLIVPLEITAEKFTSGWWSLLAYPRLYAAWLLWAAAIRDLASASDRPQLIRKATESPRHESANMRPSI
jgi:multisubunit Na+/H+ antiporter MnhC subunit